MEKTWIEMHMRVPASGVDLVCQELADLGCEGVTTEERRLDTFTPPDPFRDEAAEYQIKAYFPSIVDPQSLRQKVRERLVWLSHFVPDLVPDLPEAIAVKEEDWAQGWKQHFGTFRVGRRLVVRPSWETRLPSPEEVVITLDPGMAFGTGTHATTRLCLESLVALFDGPAPPDRILDVGTGSGILAVAAAALGAGRVLACDIDPDACRIARENARANGVSEGIEVTDRPLRMLEGGFQVVLANILAEENIRLAPELVRRLTAGGTLILSGILQEKEQNVLDAFSSLGLQDVVITRREEWSCLTFRMKA